MEVQVEGHDQARAAVNGSGRHVTVIGVGQFDGRDQVLEAGPTRPRLRFPPPVGADEKKPPIGRFFVMRWWRRRESNPRPQALYRQFYILSTAI